MPGDAARLSASTPSARGRRSSISGVTRTAPEASAASAGANGPQRERHASRSGSGHSVVGGKYLGFEQQVLFE